MIIWKIVCNLYANIETMHPNYKIILDLRRTKKNGLYPVKVRLTQNRIQKYYPLGMDLSASDFERIQNGSVRRGASNSKR